MAAWVLLGAGEERRTRQICFSLKMKARSAFYRLRRLFSKVSVLSGVCFCVHMKEKFTFDPHSDLWSPGDSSRLFVGNCTSGFTACWDKNI